MTPVAKYTQKCSECNDYIVAGRDEIRQLYDHGTIWVHPRCYIKYWADIMNQTTLSYFLTDMDSTERNPS